jgi:hypothetical protein
MAGAGHIELPAAEMANLEEIAKVRQIPADAGANAAAKLAGVVLNLKEAYSRDGTDSRDGTCIEYHVPVTTAAVTACRTAQQLAATPRCCARKCTVFHESVM